MILDEYRPPTRLFSSEKVLALIADDFRFGDSHHVAHRLSRETTVLEFRRQYGATDYYDLGKQLNRQFGITMTKRQSYDLLRPERERTVGDLCDFIAARAFTPVIEPIEMCGIRSTSAGAFVAIRRLFELEGEDVSDLHPTSPIEPYIRRNMSLVLRLSHLAPGSLPPLNVDSPIHLALYLAMCVSGLMFLASWCCGIAPQMKWWALSCEAACWILLGLANLHVKPQHVRLGWIRDFRDLSRVLVGERVGDVHRFPLD